MSHSHAVVWMDFKEAHIFRFGLKDVEKRRVRAHNPWRKVHHKAGSIGDGHAHNDKAFFDEIAAALDGVTEWLLAGPGTAKNDLLRHVDEHHRALKQRLVGVEPMDHPTDGELVDQARTFFKAFDKLHPIAPPPA